MLLGMYGLRTGVWNMPLSKSHNSDIACPWSFTEATVIDVAVCWESSNPPTLEVPMVMLVDLA